MSKRSRLFDDDDFSVAAPVARPAADPVVLESLAEPDDDDDDGPTPSSYADAAHGPQPTPSWVVTHADAVDVDLGVFKTGKEADVSLLRRSHEAASTLLAVKRYRSAEHRLFHRDAGYLEGRRMRRSRENRAMARRTDFGRELIAGQWANAEFNFLSMLWSRGAPVPYPVQLLGTEVMMEFIGTPDGVAAPRLAALRRTSAQAAALFAQLRDALGVMVEAGYTHGDLSPYNVLVEHGTDRVVLIDLPQAVDLVGNPQGFEFLHRDCVNICSWFAARGVEAMAADLEADLRGRAGT